MSIAPLIGLFGVLLAALTAEFNDGVTMAALADVRGGLAISHDPGTWIESLYATGQVIGMSVATFWAITVSIRRFALFAIAFCGVTTLCIPEAPYLSLLYVLRFLEGVSAGFIIPLLLTVALRVLPPPVRLYGLAAYALTATFGPNVATTLAALWTDLVGWRFVFWEALPLCSLAGAMVWFGVQQDPPRYQRARLFDWRGSLLVILGGGSLTTMLEQGDRYDWFNSPTICVLAVLSVVGLALLVVNELGEELPLYKFSLLRRRNFAYALIALFTFLLLNLAASTLPSTYLQQLGFKPLQIQFITLPIALSQLVLLPALALLLDIERVDPRVVSFGGIGLFLAATVGNSLITSSWQQSQFFLWQGCAAVGEAMIVMPLLMMATNTIRDPADGPFASTMVNTMRAVAEPVGVWIVQLIQRWRGGLHYNRLVDQVGQQRFQVIQARGLIPGNLPPLMPNGQPSAPGGLAAFRLAVDVQASVLTLSDAFLIVGALAVALMVVLFILPERTYPPRIEFAAK